MEVFRLCPTFHAVPPFSCLAEKRLADLHVPPSREPPLARGYPLSPASPGLPLSRLPNSAGRRCTRFPYLLCEQGAPVRASPRCSASGCWCRHLLPRSAPVGAAGTRCAPTSEAVAPGPKPVTSCQPSARMQLHTYHFVTAAPSAWLCCAAPTGGLPVLPCLFSEASSLLARTEPV